MADAVFLKFLTHNSTVLTRDTVVPMNKISAESQRQNHCFRNKSPQQKPDALQTSTLWQLKCFESR